MSDGPRLTITGRLARDPELKRAGQATVCNFTVAYTPRRYDKQRGEWVDGTTLWLECQAWDRGKRTLATNVAGSLRKGQPVIATGTLAENDWTDRDGNNRHSLRLEVDAIGLDLSWRPASPSQGNWSAQAPSQAPGFTDDGTSQGARVFGGFGGGNATGGDPWGDNAEF